MNYGRTSLRRRAKQLDARGTRIRHKIGVILGKLLLIGIIVGGCATVSFGVGAFKGILASAPDISEVDVIPTGYSTKVLAADGSETAKLVAAGSNRQYVTIDQIPENLQHAVVAIEDERFYDHNGIDLKGIVRALVADVRTRDFSQGASTLTQQLIKNNVLSEQWANENDSNISKMEKMERQVQRKIQEQYLAIELEKKVNDKNWILENYLNSINLGSNTLGVQAAAQRYFGKDVSKLTLSECAVIAGITKNPAGYNPILHPKENAKRRKNVLDAMKKQGYISQKQYDKAMADDVYGRISEHNDVREETMNTYFVDAVIDDVFDDLVNIKGYSESEAYKAIYQGGLTIKSTQNLQIQKICDEEVADKANYDAGTKYSFYLSFQVKEKDGTIKTYTNQTMLSYYKKKNKSQNYSINFASEEDCRAAIAQYEKDVLGKGDKLVENSEYIFITMQPALMLLKANGANLGITEPFEMFWATGLLSSFLDNTPTYLVFLTTAGAVGFTEGLTTALGVIPIQMLTAISCGAVFMGANTYIGNAPNFMVKSIADENGVRMPSFFGYLLWSLVILVPVFALDMLLFFL